MSSPAGCASDDEDDQQSKFGNLLENAAQTLPTSLSKRLYDWRVLKKPLKKLLKKGSNAPPAEYHGMVQDLDVGLKDCLTFIVAEHERLSHCVMELAESPALHTQPNLPMSVVSAVIAASRQRKKDNEKPKHATNQETKTKIEHSEVGSDLKDKRSEEIEARAHIGTQAESAQSDIGAKKIVSEIEVPAESPVSEIPKNEGDSNGEPVWDISSPNTAVRLTKLTTLNLVDQCNDLETLETELLQLSKLVKVNGISFKKAVNKLSKCAPTTPIASEKEEDQKREQQQEGSQGMLSLEQYPSYRSVAVPYLSSHRPYVLAGATQSTGGVLANDIQNETEKAESNHGNGDIFQFIEVALQAAADDLALRRSLIETELSVRNDHVSGQPVTLLQQLKLNNTQVSIQRDFVERQRSHSMSAAAAAIAKTNQPTRYTPPSSATSVETEVPERTLLTEEDKSESSPENGSENATERVSDNAKEKGKKKDKKGKKKDKLKNTESGSPEDDRSSLSTERSAEAISDSTLQVVPLPSDIKADDISSSTASNATLLPTVSGGPMPSAMKASTEGAEGRQEKRTSFSSAAQSDSVGDEVDEDEDVDEEDDDDNAKRKQKKQKKKEKKKLKKQQKQQELEEVALLPKEDLGKKIESEPMNYLAAPLVDDKKEEVKPNSQQPLSNYQNDLAAVPFASTNRRRLWFLEPWEEHRALQDGISFSDLQTHEQDVLYSHHSYASLATQVLTGVQAFLYRFNIAIFLPSAAFFAVELGYDPYWGAILMAILACSAAFGSLLCRRIILCIGYKWTIFGHIILAVSGNLFYAYSASADSSRNALSRALFGTILLGLGASDVLARDLVFNRLPIFKRSSASRRFAKFLAIGLLVAPIFTAIHAVNQMAIFDPTPSVSQQAPAETLQTAASAPQQMSASTEYAVNAVDADGIVRNDSSLGQSHPLLDALLSKVEFNVETGPSTNTLIQGGNGEEGEGVVPIQNDSPQAVDPQKEIPGGGAVTAAGMLASLWMLFALLTLFGYEEPPIPPAQQQQGDEDDIDDAEEKTSEEQGVLSYLTRVLSGKRNLPEQSNNSSEVELAKQESKLLHVPLLHQRASSGTIQSHVVVPIHDPEHEELLVKSGRLQKLSRASVKAAVKTSSTYGSTDSNQVVESSDHSTVAGAPLVPLPQPYVPDFPLPPLSTSANGCLPLTLVFLSAIVARGTFALIFAGVPVLAAAQFGSSLPLACGLLFVVCIAVCMSPSLHTSLVVNRGLFTETGLFLVSMTTMCVSAAVLAFAPISKVIPTALRVQEQNGVSALSELGIGPIVFALFVVLLAMSSMLVHQCAVIFAMQRDHPSFKDSFFSPINCEPLISWVGNCLGCLVLAAALAPLAIPEAALGLHNINSVAIVAAVGLNTNPALLLLLAFGPVAVVSFGLLFASLYAHTNLSVTPLFSLLEHS